VPGRISMDGAACTVTAASKQWINIVVPSRGED